MSTPTNGESDSVDRPAGHNTSPSTPDDQTTDEPTADSGAPAPPREPSADAGETAAAVASARPGERAPNEPVAGSEPAASPASRFPFGRPGRPFSQSPFLFGLTGALGVAVAWGLVQAVISVRQVLILLLVALFLAVGLNPAVEFLQRRKIPRVWCVTIVFVGVLIFVAGFFSAIVPPLVQQSQDLWENRNEYIAALQNNATINRWDERYQLIERAQDYLDKQGQGLGERLASGIIGAGKAIASGVFNTFSVLILTLYFLASLPKIKRTLYHLAPRTRRQRVELLGNEIIGRVGGYVSGAATIGLIAGVTSYIWLLAWQVPYALPLALCVLLLDLIPMIGATIGAVIVTLVAFTSGVPTGIATAIFYVGYQQLENYLIYPRVMKRAVELPAAMTVIAVLVGGSLLGVLGALLAIPSAAALLLLFREVVIPRLERA